MIPQKGDDTLDLCFLAMQEQVFESEEEATCTMASRGRTAGPVAAEEFVMAGSSDLGMDDGRGDTKLKYGDHQGLTFSQVLDQHPIYVEVLRKQWMTRDGTGVFKKTAPKYAQEF